LELIAGLAGKRKYANLLHSSGGCRHLRDRGECATKLTGIAHGWRRLEPFRLGRLPPLPKQMGLDLHHQRACRRSARLRGFSSAWRLPPIGALPTARPGCLRSSDSSAQGPFVSGDKTWRPRHVSRL